MPQHGSLKLCSLSLSRNRHCTVAVLSCILERLNMKFVGNKPREEFELTANSLGAHSETHRKPILRTLTVNMIHTVNLLLAFREFATLTMSLL